MSGARTALVFAWWALAPAAGIAAERSFDAQALMQAGVVSDLRLNSEAAAIELERGVLSESDGPAAGYSYRPNEESLGERVRLLKRLSLGPADAAWLLVAPGGDLQAAIDGRPIRLAAPTRAGGYWQQYALPADALTGDGEIVLSGKGKVWIARGDEFESGAEDDAQTTGRSAKSVDDGKTWAVDKLGPRGDLDGEYYIRVFRDCHRPRGSLLLPVIDVGHLSAPNESRVMVAPGIGRIGPVQVTVDADVGAKGTVLVRTRTGSSPVPDWDGVRVERAGVPAPAGDSRPRRAGWWLGRMARPVGAPAATALRDWSAWERLPAGGSINAAKGRYLLIEVTLATDDPLQSPRLRRVTVAASPPPTTAWHTQWRDAGSRNESIVRTSIPFRYEPFDQPRLKRFREERGLDDVVAGATSELEQIERLAAWASRQWDDGHLNKSYPAWDALEILAPHADGRPVGGFCQQYNLVFLQACESFGIPGRCVSIGPGDHGLAIRGGHEVVEVWSNEFRKWIYVDGNAAWSLRDRAMRVPLSLRELRQRQLSTVRGEPAEGVELVTFAKTRHAWTGLAGWPPFAELRLIPRSNFLEQKFPLPLNQGMRGWFWTGHYVWTDAESPASLLYGRRVGQPRNWDWSLNQAHVFLEATPTPGEVCVHLDTETPGLDTFLAAIDDEPPKRVASGFPWRLHRGKNTLRVRPRNIAGREGIASTIVLTDEQ